MERRPFGDARGGLAAGDPRTVHLVVVGLGQMGEAVREIPRVLRLVGQEVYRGAASAPAGPPGK